MPQEINLQTTEIHLSDHRAQAKDNTYQLKKELSEIDWDSFLGSKDAQGGFSSFHELFISLLDKLSPVKEITVNKVKARKTKWKTKEVQNMRNMLEALFVIKTVRKDLESENAYKTYKEIFNMKIKKPIIDINENYVNNSNNKSRAM
ncbi:hypothetical protein HHI36_018579 [Cryptolaemus montrouzieri]|uniref:Uncharacterized protein n=1 Tax=Cryptolaemus montrouzieri TaxID=559131 RepID=A0ABD2P0K0_9CUCU